MSTGSSDTVPPQGASAASQDPGWSDAVHASFRNDLIECYSHLVENTSSKEVAVGDFCRLWIAEHGGQVPLLGTEREVAFLTTLLETFDIKSRGGHRYLVPSVEPDEERPKAKARPERSRSHRRARRRAISRRMSSGRLPYSSNIAVRVTECTHEGVLIRISFHRKQDQAEVRRIVTRLNNTNLERQVRCFKGMICAAPCQGDNDGRAVFARAVVLEPANGNDGVEVRFLDFGFEELVEKGSLLKLPPDLLETPALAYTAVVHNTATNDPLERENQAFTMFTSEETFIRLVGYNKATKCYAVYVYGPDEELVGSDLGFQRG